MLKKLAHGNIFCFCYARQGALIPKFSSGRGKDRNMNCSKSELLEKLVEIVGAGWVKTDTDDMEKYGKDGLRYILQIPWPSYYQPAPKK